MPDVDGNATIRADTGQFCFRWAKNQISIYHTKHLSYISAEFSTMATAFRQNFAKEIEEELKFFKSSVKDFKKRGLRIFASSSFQTHSIPMLHIISRVDPSIPVYFLNTGFHFAETHLYKDRIADLLQLKVIDVESPLTKANQRNEHGHFYYTSDPDHCCYLNKTLPTENLLKEHDVWISGVRKDQNGHRNQLGSIEKTQYDTLRFHPMLNWNSRMIWEYGKHYDLPAHPLDEKGYMSIGCRPCTSKFDLEEEHRNSRWEGMNKTECGLHTDLIKK